jgi:hypothetical protein
MKPPPIPWTTFFVIVCGLAGAACLVLAEQPIWPSRGHAYALAVERGRQEAYAPDAEMLEDEARSHDAKDAGYRWAVRHGVNGPALCERLEGDYRAGCLDWTDEQTR